MADVKISAMSAAGSVAADDFLEISTAAGPATFKATALQVCTGGLSLAAGIAAWLADPTSAKLRTAVTDESGTGVLLFAGGALGAATATSINGLAITTSTGTLTITNGKTLAVSNTLTFTGTDSSTVACGAGGTVAYIANKLSVFAATTSAELATVLSDETGSGKVVFSAAAQMTASLTLGVSAFAPTYVFEVRTGTNKTGAQTIIGGLFSSDATDPFGLLFVHTGAATLPDRIFDLQTQDLVSGNGGRLALNRFAGMVGVGVNPTTMFHVAGRTSGNIYVNDVGQLYGSALHNNAGAVTGTTNQYVASGTYTPTVTGVTNVAATTARSTCYIRVGNVVTVAGYCEIDPTATGSTVFRISLPIASNLANAWELGGAGAFNGTTQDAVGIIGTTATDDATCTFIASSIANAVVPFTFQYVVL